MTPFTPIAHIDTWAVAASLRSKLSLFEEQAPGWSIVPVIGYGYGQSLAQVADWRALRNLIGRLKLRMPTIEISSMRLDKIAPDAETEWQTFANPIAILPIITNPANWFFCGAHVRLLPVGGLTALGQYLKLGVVNWWNDSPAIHVLIEYHMKEPADE